MLRSYRYFVFVFIGWLVLIGGSEPSKGYAKSEEAKEQTETDKSLREISAALQRANEPDDSGKPCDDSAENRKRDLCAQWKAADAAFESAKAAWWQVGLNAVGLVVGALTLGAAGAAAFYAREAAKSARESVKSDRAWLFYSGFNAHGANPSDSVEPGYMISMNIQNFGRTLALNSQVAFRCVIFNAGTTDYEVPLSPRDSNLAGKIIPPDFQTFSTPCFIPDSIIHNIRDGRAFAILRLFIHYNDMFDSQTLRETEIWFRMDIHGNKQHPDGRVEPNFVFGQVVGKLDRAT